MFTAAQGRGRSGAPKRRGCHVQVPRDVVESRFNKGRLSRLLVTSNFLALPLIGATKGPNDKDLSGGLLPVAPNDIVLGYHRPRGRRLMVMQNAKAQDLADKTFTSCTDLSDVRTRS